MKTLTINQLHDTPHYREYDAMCRLLATRYHVKLKDIQARVEKFESDLKAALLEAGKAGAVYEQEMAIAAREWRKIASVVRTKKAVQS